MDNKLDSVIKELQEKFSEIKVSEQQVVTVPVEQLTSFMQMLKDEYYMDFLTNVTAVDYPSDKNQNGEEDDEEDKGTMEVIYNVNSITEGYTLMVKTSVARQNPKLPSMFSVWGGAHFQEREVFDLLGIIFTDHPDLKRILLDDSFKGYPLRKDFQWVGGRK
ncbi:MAG: NADH-quinone oxidoreductase subunit C [Clostridiales bacterium]|nr:NADH-quinone oxidoreductase subunit C [Clostridiales bacterium]MCF8022617.1 NADH-quinone oxidoreductase subunit C [Clostridiales bacterium]